MQLRPFNMNNAAFLGVSLAFALIGGMLYFDFFGPWREPECTTYPIQVVASADGQWRAEQEQEACGTTDQLRTRVLVGRVGAKDQAVGFLAVTDKALGSMSIGQRSLPLSLRWDEGNKLVIGHPPGVASSVPAGQHGGVDVRLVAAPGK
jgi:hypothetical protein